MMAESSPDGREAWWPTGSSSAEHAHGFSSLALLGGVERHERVLYLLAWSSAIVSWRPEGEHAESQSRSLVVDGWDRVPLQRASVDTVVVDLDVVPGRQRSRRSVASELRRILRDKARCIAVVTHRRRPRNRRAWSHYRLAPPIAAWRDLLREAGLEEIGLAYLDFDGARITSVHLCGGEHGGSARTRAADAVALVLSNVQPPGRSVIDDLTGTLTRQLEADVALDRVHVRKIGKVAAFAEAGDSRVLVRLPRSPLALARARRNYAALDELHRSSAGVSMKLVPAPLLHGIAAGQHYFLETVLPGAPRDQPVSESGWEPQAIEFVTRLHAATARPALLTEAWFGGTVDAALDAIERCTDSFDHTPIRWLRATLRRRLIGRQVPLVRSHGDFTGSNCLYDTAGRLSGVVDWELSRPDALPLLDVLQCVDLPAEYTGDGRWGRAELVFDAVEGRGPLSAAPEVGAYMTALGLAQDLLVPLLLMHWVDHIAARVAVRRDDERWFRGRVTAPLRRVRQLALADDPELTVQQSGF